MSGKVTDILDHKVRTLQRLVHQILADAKYPYTIESVTALTALGLQFLTEWRVPAANAHELVNIFYGPFSDLACKHERALSWDGVDWCRDCGAVRAADAEDIPTRQWVSPGHDHNV